MKRKLVLHMFIGIVVFALVLGGVVMAWFHAKDPVSFTSMVVGTVNIFVSDAELVTEESQEGEEYYWSFSESKDFRWTFENKGTKEGYLRARINELFQKGETAWAEGSRFTNPGQWGMYYEFIPGGEDNYSTPLIAGQHHQAGMVNTWNDDNYFYVEVDINSGWEISKFHLAVADCLDLIPTTGGGGNPDNPNTPNNPIPGLFPFHQIASGPSDLEFKIPLQGEYPHGALAGEDYDWNNSTPLYVALHAEVFGGSSSGEGSILWEATPDCPYQWTEGDDGYWYYCSSLSPGEVVQLCLTGTLTNEAKEGLYQISVEGEGIQASNQARQHLWPNWPCD